MKSRSPLLGYNHNVRYSGRLYHVQTEDSGVQNPHVFTHLFFEGTILGTKRSDYVPTADDDVVRRLMQEQHKAMLRDLKAGRLDARIQSHFGITTPPPREAPPPEAAPAAAPPSISAAPPAATPSAAARPPALPPPRQRPPAVTPQPARPAAPSPVARQPSAEGVVVARASVVVGEETRPIRFTRPRVAVRPKPLDLGTEEDLDRLLAYLDKEFPPK